NCWDTGTGPQLPLFNNHRGGLTGACLPRQVHPCAARRARRFPPQECSGKLHSPALPLPSGTRRNLRRERAAGEARTVIEGDETMLNLHERVIAAIGLFLLVSA